MSTIIIVIAVIALAVLLVIRSKQGKENNTTAKKTKSTTTTAKKTAKSKPEPAKSESTKPLVDVNNVLSQIDVLIADKQFAKAEGIINQALNKDSNLHELYPKLLDVYTLQDDEFAIKQLLETVQGLNLNEVYQQLYNDYEAFKDDKQKAFQAKLSGKTPDVIEYTPQDKSLNEHRTNVENVVTRTEPSNHSNALDFDQLMSSNNSESTTETDSLQINLDSSHEENEQASNPLTFNLTNEPTLEFKLDTPQVEAPQIPSSNELEFKFETSATKSNAEQSRALEFSLEPTPSETDHSALEFKIDALKTDDVDSSHLNLLDINAPINQSNTPPSTVIETATYADKDDPIIQAFPDLAHINPIELDIELAEQYIVLGEYQAAQRILSNDQTQLSQAQAEKVQFLLQKIAS